MLPIAPLLLKALLFTTYSVNRLTIDNNVVRLNHGGKVRGTILHSEEGRPFYAFRGIPYAEPPLGQLRFKAPVAKDGWSEEFDATKEGPECPQVDIFIRQGGFVGKEDCLTLNVYTPQLPEEGKSNPKRNVLVYIHGGGFMMGTAARIIAPPERVMDIGNVVVAMNYRLDALGFLSTGDEEAPGNYGLLDQSLALQWVKDNIEAFGGNPDSVTIFGHSAGGASVSYQLLSPLSKGLFHRAAPMSGSALCSWAYSPNPLSWAKYLASKVECPETPSSAMVECLRNKPVEEVVKGSGYYGDMMAFPMPFVPTLDGHFIREVPSPVVTSKDLNHVPVLTGITEKEGAGFVPFFKMFKPNMTLTSDEFVDYAINGTVSGHYPDILEEIKNHYLSSVNKSDEEAFTKALVNIFTDGMFRMGHYIEVKQLAEAGIPVYAYSYEFRADTDNLFLSGTKKYGVGHGADMFMYFKLNWMGGVHFKKRERKMSKFLLRMLANFANTGNPDPSKQYHPTWEPSLENKINILKINDVLSVEEYTTGINPDELFWEGVRKRILEKSAVVEQ